MTSTYELIKPFRTQIPRCYKKRALEIEQQLQAGESYLSLGGRKIRSCPSLIRFKLGRSFRFIWCITPGGLKPKSITTRQKFDQELKLMRTTN